MAIVFLPGRVSFCWNKVSPEKKKKNMSPVEVGEKKKTQNTQTSTKYRKKNTKLIRDLWLSRTLAFPKKLSMYTHFPPKKHHFYIP